MFQQVTKGSLSGNAGEPAKEDFKINGQYVDTPVIDGKEGVVGIPVLRRLCREGGDRVPRRRRQDAERAVLHQRELHEGAPAEHAGAGVRAQIAVQDEICRLGRRARHPHRPRSWTSCAKPAWTRTRWFSTRPTTAPGRTSIRTPATRRSAAPRARCAKAATAFPRSPSGPARSSRRSKNHEILGGLDLMATFASVAGVKLPDERPRRQADHLRQLST